MLIEIKLYLCLIFTKMKFFIPIVICFLSLNTFSQNQYDFSKFSEGDILFQDLDCGPLCDAIESVATGFQGMTFSHMAMIVNNPQNGKDSLWVIEAYDKKVQLTPIPDFMFRYKHENGDPKVLGARMKDEYKLIAKKAAKEALKYLDKPYDEKFVVGDDAFYCSELIYYAFKNANKGVSIFELKPMTFKNQETGEIPEVWIKYFEDLKFEIPEGKFGCNPTDYSNLNFFDLIYDSGDFLLKADKNFNAE